MRVEHIIEFLNDMALIADEDRKRKNATGESATGIVLREAIVLLRTHPDAQPNEPLTLAELREMDGKPVYVMCDDGTYCWGIVSAGHGKVIVRDQYGMSADVVIWMPRGEKYYRRPPKEDAK